MSSGDLADFRRLQFDHRDHGVVVITLANEGKLNATDATMHAELSRVFRVVDQDESNRAVVVTGSVGAGLAVALLADVSIIDEASLAYEMLNFLGPDAAEGHAALVERRRPEFAQQPDQG